MLRPNSDEKWKTWYPAAQLTPFQGPASVSNVTGVSEFPWVNILSPATFLIKYIIRKKTLVRMSILEPSGLHMGRSVGGGLMMKMA